jgi:hypothetical protein
MENADSLFQKAKELRANGELKESFEYLLRTVARNPSLSEAQFWLGWAYLLGWAAKGVGDLVKSANAFQKAALQGYALAQNNLGVLLQDAVESDSEDETVQLMMSEVEHWYREAAEQGLDKAQYNLGFICIEPDPFFRDPRPPEDNTEAKKWLQKAAEQGFSEAQYALAILIKDQAPNPPMSMSWEDGEKVREAAKPFHLEAARWFYKAALQNHAESQYELGRIIADGYPVCMIDGSLSYTPSKHLPDKLPLSRFREANRWFRLAAEQGNRSAQNALGLNLTYGRGAKKNIAEAIHWHQMALQSGFGRSISRLMELADTPEFKARYPNMSYEESVKKIEEVHKNGVESGKEKRMEDRRTTHMCALPDIAP